MDTELSTRGCLRMVHCSIVHAENETALTQMLLRAAKELVSGGRLLATALHPSNPVVDYREGAYFWSEWANPKLYGANEYPAEGELVIVHLYYADTGFINCAVRHYFSAGTCAKCLREAGFTKVLWEEVPQTSLDHWHNSTYIRITATKKASVE